MGRMLGGFDKQSLGEPFFCEAHSRRLSELVLSRVSGSAMRATRTRAMAEGSSELLLVIGLEGRATVAQRGREVSVSAASALLLSAADGSRIERSAARFMSIAVPHDALAPLLANRDAALMTAIPGTSEGLRLLAGYVDLLLGSSMETPELRSLAVKHVLDLVATTLGPTRNAAEVAAGRGVRAARLRAIKADIARNLAEDVTAAVLSARHRVSARYIRKLFELENTSLSRFVLGERLARAYRLLADPSHSERKIGDIAAAVGFGDLSTFNRHFRRRFEKTPSDVRRAVCR
jgi:AraC-like DNA-binding protein